MNDERVEFRPATSWDDVSGPRLQEGDLSPLLPWGLGDAEPALEGGLEGADAYLCVACWEWQHEAAKEDPCRDSDRRPPG